MKTTRVVSVFTLCFSIFIVYIASCSRVDPKKNAGAIDGEEAVASNDNDSASESPISTGKELSEANAVAVQGDYAYVGIGRRLVIVDVSDRSKPVLVGRTRLLLNKAHHHVRGVAVVGKYAYLAVCRVPGIVGSGLLVIDVSDPTAPHEVGSATRGCALGVTVVGSHAYVYMPGSFEVVDVTDPSAPRKVGDCKMHSQSIPYTGGHVVGGDYVSISGTYAYVADQRSGMQVVDVSDPSAPKIIGNYKPEVVDITLDGREIQYEPSVLSVTVVGKYAYITAGRTSLRVLDVSDPTSPKEVGSYRTAQPRLGGAVSVSVTGKHAYVYDVVNRWVSYPQTGGLTILDVSDPRVPTKTHPDNGPAIDGDILDAELHGKYAYFCVGENLAVVDISDPSRPKIVSTTGVE